jgi:hypothetical protein
MAWMWLVLGGLACAALGMVVGALIASAAWNRAVDEAWAAVRDARALLASLDNEDGRCN